MVVLLTILGTIFLIVSIILLFNIGELKIIGIVVTIVSAILMTLCYVGAVLAQYMIEFMKQNI